MNMNSTFKSKFAAALMVALCLVLNSCKTDDGPKDEPTPPTPPDTPVVNAPTVEVSTDEVKRFAATFTITSDTAEEYAYRLREYKYTGTSEKLFEAEETVVGQFDDSHSFTFTLEGLEKDTEYLLYAATRISKDTLLYSEMIEIPFSTEIPYTDLITVDEIGLNHATYHIEKPEDCQLYRHLIVDKLDFIYFHNVVGATHTSYLDSFGVTEKQSKDIVVDEYFVDLYGYVTNIYSDMDYIVIAGTGNEEKMTEANTHYVEFSTPVAEPLEADIQIEVQNIQSTSADVVISVPENVDRYRVFVFSEYDYTVAITEDEDMVRRYILGDWADDSNEFDRSTELTIQNLNPNSLYKVGIVAFDEQMREQVLLYDFTTTDPVLPLPEFDIEVIKTDTPWNSVKINVNITNSAIEAKAFVTTRNKYEAVLAQPDVTMEMIIYNNGIVFYESELYAALHGGHTFSYTNLQAQTDYVFGIMATNEESMSNYQIYDFATETAPVVDNQWKEVLPGEYTATGTDVNGNLVSFDITIAKGVNEATTQLYQSQNRLVCLGFEPSGVEYHSPEQLLANGWAANEEEANTNYGPKFYIEFNQDGSITTGVSPTFPDGGHYLEEPMAKFNGTTLWFQGLYTEEGDDYIYKNPAPHPIDVLDDGNTIVIYPNQTYNQWTERYYQYYPGVYRSETYSYGGDSPFYAQGGDGTLVLTRKTSQQTRQYVPTEDLVIIPTVDFTLHERNFRNR